MVHSRDFAGGVSLLHVRGRGRWNLGLLHIKISLEGTGRYREGSSTRLSS